MQFNITTDIISRKVNLERLQDEIIQSNLPGVLKLLKLSESILTIEFDISYNSEQKTQLAALLSAHSGEPYPEETIPQEVNVVSLTEPEPFARPTFRTKRDGGDVWVNVNASSNSNSDFRIIEERYVSGGECLVLNAQKGDWISAEVVDKDGVIPDIPYPLDPSKTYREALCEDWPTVNKYVLRANIMPGDNIYILNTYPLNAKITVGLYLRITYHTSNEEGVRSFTSNYYLTQRLDYGD